MTCMPPLPTGQTPWPTMAPMMTAAGRGAFEITQVVQEFSTDGGTETVAWELQRAWGRLGVPSVVFASVVDTETLAAIGGAPVRAVTPWLARLPTRGLLRHAGRLLVVPGFTLAATLGGVAGGGGTR